MTPFKLLDIKFLVPEFDSTDPVFVYDEHPTYSWRDNSNVNKDLLKKAAAIFNLEATTKFDIHNVPLDITNYLFNQLPKGILEIETPDVFYVRAYKIGPKLGMIMPHIDRGRRSSINIYLKCSEQATTFYNNTLDKAQSFISKTNEVWVLDVTKPHSVTMPNEDVRTCISMSFKKIKFEKLITLF
jgi:hypothetical protein